MTYSNLTHRRNGSILEMENHDSLSDITHDGFRFRNRGENDITESREPRAIAGPQRTFLLSRGKSCHRHPREKRREEGGVFRDEAFLPAGAFARGSQTRSLQSTGEGEEQARGKEGLGPCPHSPRAALLLSVLGFEVLG